MIVNVSETHTHNRTPHTHAYTLICRSIHTHPRTHTHPPTHTHRCIWPYGDPVCARVGAVRVLEKARVEFVCSDPEQAMNRLPGRSRDRPEVGGGSLPGRNNHRYATRVKLTLQVVVITNHHQAWTKLDKTHKLPFSVGAINITAAILKL